MERLFEEALVSGKYFFSLMCFKGKPEKRQIEKGTLKLFLPPGLIRECTVVRDLTVATNVRRHSHNGQDSTTTCMFTMEQSLMSVIFAHTELPRELL